MNFRKWYDKYSKDNYKSQIKIFLNHFKKDFIRIY